MMPKRLLRSQVSLGAGTVPLVSLRVLLLLLQKSVPGLRLVQRLCPNAARGRSPAQAAASSGCPTPLWAQEFEGTGTK